MTQKHKGTTLIELVISIVIVGIALLGTLICMNTVSLYSSDPILLEQAIAIADSYLQEISSKTFPNATPCPASPSGGARSTYANVCDYNGLSQVPTDQRGAALAGLGGYTVTVTVDNSTANLNGVTGANVARIDVSVSHNAISTIRLSNYVTN